jgi:hypothetical protein
MVSSKVMMKNTIGLIKDVFWELPYANTLIIPHNIDLMHQERNGVESVITMRFDVTGFMKDNLNAKKDLTSFCDSPLLKARTNPRGNLSRSQAPYCLKSIERKEILKWFKTLKFLDRYAANIK